MSKDHAAGTLPTWTWTAPVAAAVMLLVLLAHVLDAENLGVALFAALFLGGAVFAAVHHAEVIALGVGELFGSIVLAAAVTVVEVALIVSIMLSSPGGGSEIARDTVFSAVMIVLNGIVGLCLLAGGIRHHEQGFQVYGATGTLGTLATLALILPNFTLAVPGPTYALPQLVFVAIVSLLLYGLFLFVQTVKHRDYFLDAGQPEGEYPAPSARMMVLSSVLLLVALTAVVLLAKKLSPSVDHAISGAGLPPAFVGVVIAAVVLRGRAPAACP